MDLSVIGDSSYLFSICKLSTVHGLRTCCDSHVYALNKGVSERLAFYLVSIHYLFQPISCAKQCLIQLSILNTSPIFGRVLPNFVADKIGP